MQKTNFRYEAIVHDDASTDGTSEIVQEFALRYPDIIKPILQSQNQWSKHDGTVARLLEENSIGKYIAYCEGDDYWTDSNHLQSKVDFLEKNPDFGLCYSSCRYFYQEKNIFDNIIYGGKGESFKSLFEKNQIPTLTAVYRKDLDLAYSAYRKSCVSSNEWKMGDYPRWLWFAANSKIKYINALTGVYRILNESASHSNNYISHIDFIIGSKVIRDQLCVDFCKDDKNKYLYISNNLCYWNIALFSAKNKRKQESIRALRNLKIFNLKSICQYIFGFFLVRIPR